jgi:hypothetical protein
VTKKVRNCSALFAHFAAAGALKVRCEGSRVMISGQAVTVMRMKMNI